MSKMSIENIRQVYDDIIDNDKYTSIKLSKETFIALVDKANLGCRGYLYSYEELEDKVIEYQTKYDVMKCELSATRADIKYLVNQFEGFMCKGYTIDINFDYWKKQYHIKGE